MAEQHNKEVLDTLEKGDIVEFDRGPYSHYGIYTENEKIIHRSADGVGMSTASSSSPSSMPEKILSKASIQEGNFFDTAGNSKAYKSNMDDKYTPYSKDEIVKRAEERIGETGYNAVTNNCEHFTTDTRYGKAESQQINDIAQNYLEYGSLTSAVVMHGLKRTANPDDAV